MGVIRRATGQHISHFDRQTKSDLLYYMEKSGFDLFTERSNVGEWNESRTFWAVKGDQKEMLGYASKGEPVDWDAINHVFFKVPGAKFS